MRRSNRMAAYPGLAKVVSRNKMRAGFDEFVDWYGLLISAEKCGGNGPRHRMCQDEVAQLALRKGRSHEI